MKFSARIDQLIDEAIEVEKSKSEIKMAYGDSIFFVDDFKYEQWKIKVKNLLELILGKESIYLRNFCEVDSLNYLAGATHPKFIKQYALLSAFKDDYEKGYLTSLKVLIEADIFDTELEQAKELLTSKYKLAAAVIAGIVLETALRSLCDKANIPHGKLTKMNEDLTKAGVYNKFQQKSITALADIRNSAAHGKDSEFTHENVENMIRDIESFLSTHLN
jgi:hypothetical protein